MLTGKTILVSGGAGLLGSAFCKSIVDNNGFAVVADIDEEAATRTVEAISIEYQDALLPMQMDITDRQSIETVVENAEAANRPIHALINSAYPKNANYGRPIEEVEYDSFCDNLSTNVGGYFLTSQVLAEYFCKKGSGNIINIASVYGVIPPRFDIYEGAGFTMPVEYAAIKAAIIHLTRYFAQYYKKQNLRVNAISPGGIEDNHSDKFAAAYAKHCATKGMLDVEDTCGTLLFLLSEHSAAITGQNIVVDDGFTL